MRTGADFLARFGLAFAFLYPPLDALLDPYTWVGYIPSFLRGIAPNMVLLHGFGLIEVALALWILSGRKIFIPSLLAAAILFAIVLFNLTASDFQVLFRDVSIAFLALSLAAAHRPQKA
jgi:hypothetical protein